MPIASKKTRCLIAVISVLCWGTMNLQPRLSFADFKGSPSLMVKQRQSDRSGFNMELVRRPITALFRHFQRSMSTSRWRQPISGNKVDDSTALYVSSLNYASLKMIHLVWVDNLSGQLDFDSTNRSLSVFKFPSFCALSTLEDSNIPPIFAR